MPIHTYTANRHRPGYNVVWRAPRQASALDRFALVRVANRGKKRRPLSVIRTPGVEQSMGNIVVNTPFGKDDDEGMVIVGKAERFYEQVEADIAKAGEISETERRVALATNVGGVVAAPGLIYMAARGAKNNEGSWPRAAARGLANKRPLKGTSTGKKILRAASKLDRPMTPKQRAAAIAAGTGLVGLQAGNVVGDAIAARAMANAERA